MLPSNPDIGDRYKTNKGVVYEYVDIDTWEVVNSVSLLAELIDLEVVFETATQVLTNKEYSNPKFTNVGPDVNELAEYIIFTYLPDNVPGDPRNVHLEARTKLDDDGKVDLRIVITWDAPLGHETDDNISYEVYIADEQDDMTKQSKDRKAWTHARSSIEYTVKVRTISRTNRPSNWTTPLTITPSKKGTRPTRPDNLIANGKSKRVKLKWDESPDKDYRHTNIYSSTTNDFSTADKVGAIHGTRFIDDNLFDNTDYYYWITHVDRSHNESNKYPIDSYDGIKGTTDVGGGVDDHSPPDPPTGLHLEQRTILDQDGKIDLYIIAYWSAAIGAATGVSYQIKVTDADDTYHYASKDLKVRIHANSGVHYDVEVRALSHIGIPSTWLGPEGMTPNKKATLPTTPTGLVGIGRHGRIRLKWDESPDRDYKRTLIYSSITNDFLTATEVGSIAGSRYIDDGLLANTFYYYWISHKDRSGNESYKFPSGRYAGYEVSTSPDTEVTEDFTPPGVPTGLHLSQRTDLDDDGKVIIKIFAEWSAPAGDATGVLYEVQYRVGGIGGDKSSFMNKDLTASFHARSGVLYDVRVRAVSINNIPGDWTDYVPKTPDKKNTLPTAPTDLFGNSNHKRVKLHWTESTDKDFAKAVIYRAIANDFTLAEITGKSKSTTYVDDDLANFTDYWYWITFVDRSFNESNKYPTSNTNGVHIKTKRINDDDTDDTQPDKPTNVLATQRTNLDDDGKVDLKLIITWDAASGSSTKNVYEVHFRLSGDNWHIMTKDTFARVDVRSGQHYFIKVRAISFSGVASDWTDEIDVTTSKKSTLPSSPTDLERFGGHKHVKLKWPESPDKDYHKTVIYRSLSNDFSFAEEAGRIHGTTYVDDDLMNFTDYWYWITFKDRSGNESDKFPLSNTGGYHVKTTKLAKGDIDNDPPNIPSNVNLDPRTDLDDDGKTVLFVIATWTAHTGKDSQDTYEVNINNGSDNWRHMAKDEMIRFSVRSGVTYTVKVRAVSFSGKPSDWSDPKDITPSKKSTLPTIPAGLAGNSNHKRVKLHWDESPDKDYHKTIIYRSLTNDFNDASETGRVHGTTYVDDDLANFTEYWYWITHLDRSHNESNKYPVSNTGGVYIKTRHINDDDLDDNVPNKPSNLLLSPRTVLDDDGKIDLKVIATWTAQVGHKNKDVYEVKVTKSGDSWNEMMKDEVYRFNVVSGVQYDVKVRAVTFAGIPSDWSDVVSITPSKKSTLPTAPTDLDRVGGQKRVKLKWPESPDKDYNKTIIYRATVNDFAFAAETGRVHGTVYVDDDLANHTTYFYWITFLDRSRNESNKFPSSNTGGYSVTTTRINPGDLDDTPPGVPTSLSLTQRTNLDDDGKVDLKIIITWDLAVGGDSKDTFEVHVNDGTDTWRIVTKEPHARFEIRSGLDYDVKVREISFAGVAGDWTSVVTLHANKKSTLPSAPTSLTTNGGHKRVKLKWDESADKDYAKTIVYRAALNDFTTAAEIGRTKGTTYIDDDLLNKQDYYYWITFLDRSRNESNKYPTSNTAGVHVYTTQINDDDTDDTAPNTPTGLSATQRTKLDDDGKVDLKLQLSWTAHSGAKPKDAYVIYVADEDDDWRVTSKEEKAKINVRSGITYTIKVRATTFNGVAGNWSTPITITPSKKATTPTAPTSLTATGKHGRIVLRWNKSPDKDYKRTNVYVSNTNDFTNASQLDSVSGTKFEHGDLNNNVTRYYWITFEDRSGNESNKYPTSNTAGISATTVKVGDDDTEDNVLGAPTGLSLTQRTNLDDDGKVDLKVKATWTAPAGASAKVNYELHVTDGTDDWRYKSDDTVVRFEVRSSVAYTVKVRAVAFNGVKGSWSSTVNITPSKKGTAPTTASGLVVKGNHKRNRLKWTKCPDKDYSHTNVYRNTVNVFPGGTPLDTVKGSAFIDDDLTVQTYYYWVSHVDKSGNEGATSSVASDTPGVIGDTDTDSTAPSVPTGLALNQTARDVDEDGKIDIAVNASWNSASGAKTYAIQITQGSDVSYHQTDDLNVIFKAKSNKLYSVKVRALSFNGTKSALSSAVTITPVKKSALPTIPANLAGNGNHKRIKLSWDECTDKDYSKTIIYRATTNNYASASEVGRSKATRYVDDDLSNVTTYYYWITHLDTSGNEGPKYPVSSTGGVAVSTVRVGDTDTDQTSLGVPTGLSLNQTARDVDEDGKIDIAVNASWTAVSGAKTYAVEITQGSDVTYHHTDDVSYIFKAKSNKLYSVKVRSLTFNGTKSALSSAVTITPVKKSALPTIPAGLAGNGNHKRIKLSWTESSDKDYSKTVIYRASTNNYASAAEVGRVKGTRFVDDDLSNVTTYYYWITHLDTSGNEGPKYPSSDTAGISVSTVRVGDTDTDQTAAGVPSGLSLTQTNKDIDEDGKIDIAIKATWSTVSGAKAYALEITQGSDVSYHQTDDLSHIFKAKSNKLYSVKVRSLSFNGTKSSLSGAVTLTPSKKSAAPSDVSWEASNPIISKPKAILLRWQEPTDDDYKKTVVYRNTSNSSGTATEIGRVSGTRYKDDEDLSANTTYYYWLKHLDTSGNLSTNFSSVQSISWKLVSDADTDTVAVSVPSGLTLTQTNKDVDEDGKVDIAIKATWSTVSGAKSYSLEITQGSDVSYHHTDDLSYIFKAKSNKLYSVKVRSLTFNGTKSALSSAVTLTPSKKSAAPTTAAGLTAVAKAKGVFLKWTRCSDNDYKETIINRGGSEIARVKGSAYKDDEELVVGTTYSYTVQHVDTSGNSGTASSSVNAVYTGLNTSDLVGTSQATINRMANSAMSTLIVWSANTTFYYATIEPDTVITKNGVVQVTAASATTGNFSAAQGDIIESNKPIGAQNGADTLMSLAWTGKKFTDYWTRTNTLAYYVYSPTKSAKVTITVGAGTPVTTTVSPGVLTYIAPTDGATYSTNKTVTISSDAPICLAREAGGTDYYVMFPNSYEVLISGSSAYINGTVTFSSSSAYYRFDAGDGTIVQNGDGSGGDGASGRPRASICTNYLITHDMYDYAIVAVEPTVITVYSNAGTVLATIDGSAASTASPFIVLAGDTQSGAGTTLLFSAGAYFVGTAPFYLRTNDPSTDKEYSPIGWRDDLRVSEELAGGTKPTGLTLTQTAKDVDEDGKVDIAIKVTWTAVAGATGYAIEVTQGSDVTNHQSDDATFIFKAKSNKLYSVRVRSIGKTGKKSAWTSASTLTPAKKSAAPTDVSWEASNPIIAKPKAILLRWQEPSDNDYGKTVVYRNTSNSSGTASEIGRIHGTRYKDDEDLTPGSTYYYWLKNEDRSGNLSTNFSSVQSVTWKAVTDSDTDQVALATPSGLGLSQLAKDVDDDGKVDIAVKVTWTAVSNAKSYGIEVTQGSDISYHHTDDVSFIFKAKTSKLYSVKVRSLTFNGTKSALSSAVTITPVTKSAAPTTPAWEASNPIIAKPKGILLRWQEPSDNDYKKTVIYRNTANNSGTATEIGRASGTRYKDDEELVAGTTYYYWLKHSDTSGNLSAFSTVQSAAWKSINDSDTDTTAAGIPTGLTLNQAAKDVDEDGKVDIAVIVGWTAVSGAKSYSVRIEQGTDISYHQIDDNNFIFKAKSNKLYSVQVRSLTFNGTKSSLCTAVTITPSKKSAAPTNVSWEATNPIVAKPKGILLRWQEPTDNDYGKTIIYRNTSNNSGTASEIGRSHGTRYKDDEELVVGTTYYYWLKNEDRSGNLSTSFSSVQSVAFRQSQTNDIENEAVTDGKADQTAPGVPGAPTVTKQQNVNGDGSVDTRYLVSWTIPSTSVPIRYYEVKINNTTDSQIEYKKTKNLSTTFIAVVGKTYQVSIQSIAFGGVESGFGTATPVTPTVITFSVPTPTWVTASGTDAPIIAKPRSIQLRWTKVTGTFKSYAETIIYRYTSNNSGSAVEIGRTSGTRFKDDDDLTPGTTYYYWLKHMDTSENLSAFSSVQSATYRRAQGDDVEQSLTLGENLAVDPSFESGTTNLYVKTNGTLTNVGGLTGAPYGSRALVLDRGVTDSSVSMNIYYSQYIPVEDAGSYYMDFMIRGDSGAGAVSSAAGAYLRLLFYDGAKSAIAGSNGVGYRDFYQNGLIPSSWTEYSNVYALPAGVKYVRFQIYHHNTSTILQLYVNNVTLRRQVDAQQFMSDGTLREGKTDQTTPDVPTGLNVSQHNRDLDGDGRVDIALKIYCSQVTTGVPVRHYEFTIRDGGSNEEWMLKADGTANYPTTPVVRHSAIVGRSYTVYVRSVSFNGKKSGWSSGITFSPVAKSALPTAPSGISITAKPKGMLIEWAQPSDKDIRRYDVYVNTSNSSSSGGNTYKAGNGDHWLFARELSVGTPYYFFVRSVDRSGNNSAYVAASNNPQTFRQAQSNDVEDSAIQDNHFSGQLDYGKVKAISGHNMFRNADFDSGGSSGWLFNGWSVVARGSASITGAPSKYVCAATANSTYKQAWIGNPTDKFEVSDGETFAARFFAAATATATAGQVYMQFRFENAASDGVYVYRTLSINLSVLAAAGTWQEVKGQIVVPTTVNSLPTAFVSVYMEIGNTATAGTVYFCKPRARRATDNDMLGAEAVMDANADQTAPGVPGAPTLTKHQYVDGDGSVNLRYEVTWSAPSTSVPIRYYEVKINNSTDGHIEYKKTKNLSTTFSAVSGKSYTVAIQSIAFGGVESGFGTTSPATPTTITNSVPTPTWVTASGTDQPILAKPRSIQLRWTKVASTFKSYAETVIYRNTSNNSGSAVEVGRVSGTRFKDDDDLTPGTTYYYWLKYMDMSENLGSFSSVQSVVYTGTRLSDMNVNDMMANVENNDLSLGPNIGWSDASIIVSDAVNAFRGTYVMKRTSTGSYVNRNKMIFPVRAGEQYYIGGMIKTDGTFAASLNGAGFRLSFVTDAAGGSEVTTQIVFFVTSANTTWTEYGGKVTVPATSTIAFARLEVVVYNQTAGTVYWSHMYCRPVVTDGMADKTAPSLPVSVGLNRRQNTDGDGIVNTKISVTWSAPSSTNVPIAYYEVKVSDGTDVAYHKTQNLAYMIHGAVIGKTYGVQVAAISVFGVTSGFTTNLTDTPTSPGTAIATPSTPTVALKPKGIIIRWETCTDKTYKETIINRGGSEIGRVKGNRYVDSDDALTDGTGYTYTIQHVNRSDVASTASSASSSVTFRNIGSGMLRSNMDTENKIPAGDFDEFDNDVDIDDIWTITNGVLTTNFWIWTGGAQTGGKSLILDNRVTGGSGGGTIPQLYITSPYIPVKLNSQYYWEIMRQTTDGSSSVGLYYRIYWFKRDKTASSVTTFTDVLFNGSIPSSWTATDGIVTVPSDATYCQVRIYHNNNSTTRYLILDRVVLRKADGANLVIAGGIIASQTDQTAPSTPGSGPTVAQTNKDTNGDGTIDMQFKLTAPSLPTGAKGVYFEIAEYDSLNTTLIDTYYEYPKKLTKRIPVIAGHYYRVKYGGVSFNNVEGALNSTATTLKAAAKTSAPTAPSGISINGDYLSYFVAWAAPDVDVAYTEVGLSASSGTQPSFVYATARGTALRFYYPTYNVSNDYIWVRHVNNSGVRTSWTLGGSSIITKLGGSQIASLSAYTVSKYYEGNTSGNQSLVANTEKDIQTLSVDKSGSDFIRLSVMFNNNDGASGRQFTVKLYDGASVIRTWTTIQCNDQAQLLLEYYYQSPGSGTVTFKFTATCANATTVSSARLGAHVVKA